MNPPFARIPGPEDLDLNVSNPRRGVTQTTETEIDEMKQRMTGIRHDIGAANGNGMALHFSHLAHRMVRPGGTIALLLPASALSGGGGGRACVKPDEPQGWEVFRGILAREYCDVTVVGISEYTNEGSTFSDKTSIPEIMLIARKAETGESTRREGFFASLRKQPGTLEEARIAANAILEAREELRETRGETVRLTGGRQDLGSATRTGLPEREIWAMARTLRPEVVRTAGDLSRGMIRNRRDRPPAWLPIAKLSEVARVGITEFDLRKLILEEEAPSAEYEMLHGHDSSIQRTLETEPNRRTSLAPGRERSRSRLEMSLGRLHLNDNFRYNSQPAAACLTPQPSLGGKAWPNVVLQNEQHEKALAIWMNCTPGLVTHWANSNHGQAGLGYLSAAQMKKLPVLDVTRLLPEQLSMIEQTFEEIRHIAMLPASEAWRDPIRQELDRRILGEILGLGEETLRGIAKTRNRWCLEPTVMGRKGATVNRQEQRRELEALAA